jgi:RNA 2',3'-cyclic 3'-phosphodiesterase
MNWRLFYAFELPEELRSRIGEHVRMVREAVPDAVATWIRTENIHLTVKFFGMVSTDRIESISKTAERVAGQFAPITVSIGGTGVFPRASRPQVLWIGVGDLRGTLAAFQAELENEFAGIGLLKEEREFRPHLTIARIRRPEKVKDLGQVHLNSEVRRENVVLDNLVLFRSELSKQGSTYTPVSRHRLE